ncbi:MAG TPA: hypothetical protein VK488_08675 [Gaiellaceae bacterium]|nr:hypothetical protein [Gaiellaceae bacterium]
MRKAGLPTLGLFAALVAALISGSAAGSVPPASTVTVPTTAGQVTDTWTGTIAPGANATSDCSAPFDSVSDLHEVTINVTPGTYDTIDAQFKFTITWAAESSSDEILTVVDPHGDVVGSSDGGSNVETVVANNLPPGRYEVLACAFLSTELTDYDGKLEITTTARTIEQDLPSASANGLAFSAAVASDNQRDQSEPLLEIDKAGRVYDCGPTGFSNFADYAQVSTDHGDQFHMLGTPPRGQQAAGGGGDCGLAFGTNLNAFGFYQYAYTGLGPLTGFATSTSPNGGQSLGSGGPAGNGNTDEGAGADRQWMTFVDSQTVLLSYNQQEPRNVVVQRSTDGGLTYQVDAARASRNPRYPGPMRYIEPTQAYPNGIVYFASDRTASDGDHVNLSISQDRGLTWTDCLAAVAPGTTTLFATADHDNAGNIYVVYGENVRFHTYLVTLTADKIGLCNEDVTASTDLPTTNPGFSAPTQVDRDAVRTTLFAWVTAGGAPGRAAVVFVGTESDGDPNSGNFKASWNIYVNETVNALSTDPANPPTFSQVKVTTHPFHYDSICINGLGCDLSVPPGDRSMADFISLDTNRADGRIYVTWDRANKVPDEAVGHVASPMVSTQIGGPALNGGTIGPDPRQVLRGSSTDPTGDALSSFSVMAPGTAPPNPPTTNEAAADFTSVSVGPEIDLLDGTPIANGGVTLTMHVSDLSTTSLLTTAARTQSQSLLWLLRFTNGYQDVAAGARWNAGQGFSFGYNDYTTGNPLCEPAGPATQDKCILYPGDQPIQGDVNQVTGTIRFNIPRYLMRALSGPTGPGQRPLEVAATVGSRFYDGTAFSLGNSVSVDQTVQSFLYPLDNTPSMDFLLPTPPPPPPLTIACKITGGGKIPAGNGEGKFSLNVHVATPPSGSISYRDGSTDFHSTSIGTASCPDRTHGHVAGYGVNNGNNVSYTVDVVDGSPDTFSLTMTNGGTRSGALTKGDITVHKR